MLVLPYFLRLFILKDRDEKKKSKLGITISTVQMFLLYVPDDLGVITKLGF